MHRGRKSVVGALSTIHMVIRMDAVLAAQPEAEHLVGAVGDDLVDVHVGLGAAAGLPDDQREVNIEHAVDHLLAGVEDRLGELLRNAARPGVHFACGLLCDPVSADEHPRKAVLADGEVPQRALRLGTPIPVGWDLDWSEAVGFRSCGRGQRGSPWMARSSLPQLASFERPALRK